jgi:hypothetical protein
MKSRDPSDKTGSSGYSYNKNNCQKFVIVITGDLLYNEDPDTVFQNVWWNGMQLSTREVYEKKIFGFE